MKASFVTAVLAALPAWVSAVAITNTNFNGIETGKPFEITWSDAAGPVSLTLKDGPSDNLKTVSEITCKSYKNLIAHSLDPLLTIHSRPDWHELHLGPFFLAVFWHLRPRDQRRHRGELQPAVRDYKRLC